MGSVSLITVPKAASDYAALVSALRERTAAAARERIRQDPSFMLKLRALTGQ